jgi:acetyl-CoA carboxylase carboxyltransferase component
MSWDDEVEGIHERHRRAAELGGAESVARHHERGRWTVRERVAALVDDGSFEEQGPIAGHSETDDAGNLVSFRPANYVLGLGRVHGRPCAVGGEDFTQRGGSPTAAGLRKSVYAEELALRYRVPLVRFLEGGGGSVTGTGGKGAVPTGDPVYATHRFASIAKVMATAPVVSAAMGAVAGFPAARLVASHLSLMVQGNSQVMIAGPAVVERALGEVKTKEELGGAAVHAMSGVVDAVCADEAEVCQTIRAFLSYLPTNVDGRAPLWDCDDDPARRDESLLSIIPHDRRKSYDARALVEGVVDSGSFLETGKMFGRSQIVGLARLGGQSVGVWANDCRFFGGALSADGAQKVRRFIDLCDTFHLPIVSFVDEPGFLIGSGAEAAATIRHGAATICATVQSNVPWASVIVRKAYGVAAAAHFGPEGQVFAWPSAESGALPVEGGVAVAFRKEIAAAADPDAHRRELEESFAALRDPFGRAEAFGVHDLIDPRDTRRRLCSWVNWIQPQLDALPGPRSYSYRP